MCFLGLQYAIFFELSQQADQSAHRDYSTQAHIDYAEDAIDRECLNLEGMALRDCIHENIESARDHNRAESDLDAQEQMAQFTRIMGYAAIAGLFIGLVSVIAIFLTLRATQKMAAETSRIGDAQVKASNEAVKTAQDANAVAAKQFRAGFKPWIRVEVREPFVDQSRFSILFEAGEERSVPVYSETFIHCIGDIPATIEHFSIKLADHGEWSYAQNPPDGWSNDVDYFHILQSNTSVQIDRSRGVNSGTTWFADVILNGENISSFCLRPPPIIGTVIYSDPMGVRYEHNFAFVMTQAMLGKFKRYGGTAYNYEQEIIG